MDLLASGYIIVDSDKHMFLYTVRSNRHDSWMAFYCADDEVEMKVLRKDWKRQGLRCVYVVLEAKRV